MILRSLLIAATPHSSFSKKCSGDLTFDSVQLNGDFYRGLPDRRADLQSNSEILKTRLYKYYKPQIQQQAGF